MVTLDDIKVLLEYFKGLENAPVDLKEIIRKLELIDEISKCNNELEKLMKKEN